METASPSTVPPFLPALVLKRRRSGWLVYAFLLLAWGFAAGRFLDADVDFFGKCILLLPIVVLAVQMILPTLLGWLLVFIPVVGLTGYGIYALATDEPVETTGRSPLEELIILAVLAGLVVVCVILLFTLYETIIRRPELPTRNRRGTE